MLRRSTILTSLATRDAITFNSVHTTITTAGNVTYTASQINGGFIDRNTNGLSRSDTMPTTALLYAQFGKPEVNQTFSFVIKNTAGAAETITILAGTGMTLTGTMTIAQSNLKVFYLTFTSPTACTLYSIGSLVY